MSNLKLVFCFHHEYLLHKRKSDYNSRYVTIFSHLRRRNRRKTNFYKCDDKNNIRVCKSDSMCSSTRFICMSLWKKKTDILTTYKNERVRVFAKIYHTDLYNSVIFLEAKLGFCIITEAQIKAILPRRGLRWQKRVYHALLTWASVNNIFWGAIDAFLLNKHYIILKNSRLFWRLKLRVWGLAPSSPCLVLSMQLLKIYRFQLYSLKRILHALNTQVYYWISMI